MCCQNNTHQTHAYGHGHSNSSCECAKKHQFVRRFQTRDEQITHLNTYLSELQAEVNAVNEQITQLQAD
ncbi:MAG: hypothetical protein JEZ00_18005 [Anaerolineaceae bacterium]|nr:hypothetical protein [Anaerolineaceae bacterium]